MIEKEEIIKEAERQKNTAISLFNTLMGLPEGYSNNAIELIVENIISSALLEMSVIVQESITEIPEKSL